MKVEYRVRPVTRYVVTRWHQADNGHTGGCESRGEFDNAETAYAVAYALCKHEHDSAGTPLGDENFKYPEPLEALSVDLRVD